METSDPMRPTQAVILAGGLGTRLGDLTKVTPKPLLPVDGVPFIEHLIRNLIRFGFSNILVLCGYKADQFDCLATPQRFGAAQVRISKEPPSLLGTGGALKHAAPLLEESFLMMNGDTLFDINYLSLSLPLSESHALGRVALRRQSAEGRYGSVLLAGDKITSFAAQSADASSFINGGVYFLRKTIIDEIQSLPCSIEQDIFPKLVESGLLEGTIFDGAFLDIGIPSDFERAGNFIHQVRHRPAAFLDRDGVLNIDHGYTHRPDQLVWVEGAKDAVRWLNDKGFYVFVVTNQAGVAKGYYSCAEVEAFHAHMNMQLAAEGAHVDAFEYCPFHPEGSVAEFTAVSDRRKPGSGMIQDLVKAWPIDLARSIMIGDRLSDIEAAEGAGVTAALFSGGNLFSFMRTTMEG